MLFHVVYGLFREAKLLFHVIFLLFTLLFQVAFGIFAGSTPWWGGVAAPPSSW
jgi:hypothetical protein